MSFSYVKKMGNRILLLQKVRMKFRKREASAHRFLKIFHTIVCILILLFSLNLAYADNSSRLSAEQLSRFQSLTKEIRCVVCQNQNIADSNAPLANDLRAKIYKMMSENKTNNEIKDYLVQRYGEFILLQPRLNKLTFLLWAFPFIGFASIFFFLKRFIKIY